MGFHHRHRTAERIFIAGDVDDLPAIAQLLRGLPDDAYGQVIVEVLDPSQIRALPAPERITVSWLARSARPSRIGPLVFAARGEALTEAISAWVAEWMPGEPDAERTSLMWIGCAASLHVTALYDHLGARLQNLQALPEQS